MTAPFKNGINNGNLNGRRISLSTPNKIPSARSLFFLFLMVPSITLLLRGADSAALRGEVRDVSSTPLSGVRIELSSLSDPDHPIRLLSDDRGCFRIAGLEADTYTAQVEHPGFKPLQSQRLHFQEGRLFRLHIDLAPESGMQISRSRLIPLDETLAVHETILDAHHIHELPSAHNIWALVENQDLSATTDRIDIGGLWSSQPALFSARGGTSWTQSVYMINGMSVTDPYQTGRPLVYPDFYSLRSTRLINGGAPAFALTPGGQLDMTPFEGGDEYSAGVSAFYIPNALQSSNITPGLESEGLFESNGFDYFLDGNLFVSGPIIPNRLTGYASFTAFDLSQDLADYENHQNSRLLSGLANLKLRLPAGSLHLFWTGQTLDSSDFGAGRGVPVSATTERDERYHVLQAVWKVRPHHRHALDAGLSYSTGHNADNPTAGDTAVYRSEIFSGDLSGGPASLVDENRSTLTARIKGESLLAGPFGTRHRLLYGFRFQRDTARTAEVIGGNGLHLHFYNGAPLEIVRYRTEVEHRESARHLQAYLQDSVTLSCGVTLYAGAHMVWSRGSAVTSQEDSADSGIDWRNLAPRVGIIIPLNRSRTSLFKIAYGRYLYSLPLNYLTYGHPDAQGGQAFSWIDRNDDRSFQPGEAGGPLRREGPLYGEIDPNLRRPVTDEVLLSYSATFGTGWTFTLSGFARSTTSLVRSLNSGVTFNDYVPLYVMDSGDDRIPYTYDDLGFTVFNQTEESLGRDFFLLSNVPDDTRNTFYYGFDLNLLKRFGERFTFFLSLTATQADGAGNPGNSVWENDDGLPGELFDDPNTLINAKGRLRFDRAYTGRLGIHYRAPLGINLGCIIKYYDGIPFTRRIIVENLNQGPIAIQAHPRGVARYEYNRTIDIRIEKVLHSGRHRLRLIFDGFNITNLHQATEENEWTGPEFPLRYATEIQSPRVFRIGLSYDY